MKINQIRISFFLMVLALLLSQSKAVSYYVLVMWGSLEFLNLCYLYIRDPRHYRHNFKFWLFTVFVVINRSRPETGNIFIEQFLNILEHFFFALVLGQQLLLIFKIFGFQINLSRVVLTVSAINILGFFNELFQNLNGSRPLFSLSFDAKKDMFVNLIGSLVFLLYFMFRRHKKRREEVFLYKKLKSLRYFETK